MSPNTVLPRSVDVQRAPADIGAAVEVFSANCDASCILFIIEQRRWEEQLKVITQARATTLHNRILIHRSALSPLAVSTLTEILEALRPQLSAAQLLAACAQLEAEIAPFALVRSAAKLSAANPSVWQHISSWLPSTTFIARAGGRVVSTTKLTDRAELFKPYAGWVQMAQQGAAAAGGSALQTVRELAPPSTFLERTVEAGDFWGTPTITEWCYAPADIAGLVADIQSRSRMCDWCQEPFAAPQCPSCSSPSFYGGSQS